jgi:hypothetical protein
MTGAPRATQVPDPNHCRHCGEPVAWRTPGPVAFADGTAAHLPCYERAEVERLLTAARRVVAGAISTTDEGEILTAEDAPQRPASGEQEPSRAAEGAADEARPRPPARAGPPSRLAGAPTRSGHYRLRHPAGGLLYAPSTPSDPRSIANLRADLRRAERRAPDHQKGLSLMPSIDTDALIAGLGMDRASQLAVLKEMQERLAGRTDQLRVLLRLVPLAPLSPDALDDEDVRRAMVAAYFAARHGLDSPMAGCSCCPPVVRDATVGGGRQARGAGSDRAYQPAMSRLRCPPPCRVAPRLGLDPASYVPVVPGGRA